VIPWIVMAVVVVPLVVIAFVASRRKTAAGERIDDPKAQERTEQEFAEAEAYDAEWREEDKERHRKEFLP
jgi:uncharacterized membrane protein